jgi:outer membrane protein assembly factor BamE (lipoprotein component of BamABCDE complex)
MVIRSPLAKGGSETGIARRGRWRQATCAAVLAIGLSGLAGCAETVNKGYIVDPGALEQIPVGSSQEQVLVVLGTPSTMATLNGEVFYYISGQTKQAARFMRPTVVDQRVLAVYFDKDRRVERVADYGIKDGKVFDFVTRTTPAFGRDSNFLAQVFKGVLGGGGS